MATMFAAVLLEHRHERRRALDVGLPVGDCGLTRLRMADFGLWMRRAVPIRNQADPKSEGRRVLGNFSALAVVQFANYLAPLITLPYLFRVLGPSNYGLTEMAAPSACTSSS